MNQKQPIRIILVDDHRVVRDGLKLLLSTYDDLEIVALAGDGEQAISLCSRFQPDVVVMDLSLPGIDGPMAIARLRTLHPAMQFIALTSFLEEQLIQRALKAGAVGYLLKSVSGDKLAEAIRGAVRGEVTLDASATQLLVQSVAQPQPVGHDLTPREREVLALLVEGKTNQEIAETLTLGYGTVRVYVSNVLSKLGAGNRTEAVSLALRHKIVQDSF